MRTICLTLAYDGTDHVGWQRQAQGSSIQGLLEQALEAIEQQPVVVTGAGRTDAGVHAAGQVASCRLANAISCDALVRAVNARLPSDVRVLRAEERSPDFHARFSARSKTYRYAIGQGPVPDPFTRRFVWHVPVTLDVVAMAVALDSLQGTHDYAAFQATGSEVSTTVRTLTTVSCRRSGGGARELPAIAGVERILVEVTGDGFLRHMVRNIVGTLVEVGAGRRASEDVAALLASRDRRRAGPTAPAQGLCLVRVDYA